jgi:hypothetical protein
VTAVGPAIIPRPLRMTKLPDAAGVALDDRMGISYAPGLEAEAQWFRSTLQAGTGRLVTTA